MLLNCFGQPTLLQSGETYLGLDEFKNAPMLLCHKNAMEECLLPPNWSGNLFATQDILKEIRFKFQPPSIQTLYPNETRVIQLPCDGGCQYNPKNVEITAIPWNREYLMYLIKDDNVVNLLTDRITEDMTAFVQNKCLRNSIKCGIDVLYVNDSVYNSPKKLKTYPSEFLLGALVTIVRPRFIKGFSSEEQLPPYIEECCMHNDIYCT